MGTCFSSKSQELFSESTHRQTALVVSINGDLHKYILPVLVSYVLNAEASSSSAIFLCNSDSLSYDEYIPALDVDHQLQADQIYFVLPVSKLQHRLASRDMAALAVKTSLAIENNSKNDSRRKRTRISPVTVVVPAAQSVPGDKTFSKAQPQRPEMTRSGSIKKLHRYTSRRAKLAVRSFRLRLSTIYEGSVL